ncbi:hypothetical protein HBI56_142200 [Parastagonospora nodorum]|uniref:Uncharacterized protein n=2 Tax=Phaeosphaeria nodorum (strain SN15 / ATCC MYA-4574 / FGSC 10173) TaxID=321614 RepID=A0A7U2F7E9_PHANO|nr:hypothetical protein HBH56_034870 [Parastagonospora nodorum]QRD00136.1 hypothetical protein JI435_070370 [Parastagonospora nodorum SN15]KAH3933824.1 hypothetical protein HBH54_064580 [Parastagonospora nodorum]KAH3952339.1 hypothetical protein HBH53_045500 [Parastagonospora nodorum]KAH3979591.1 hypothetical protein HBH51_056510 [Parastagonospora nodorum]
MAPPSPMTTRLIPPTRFIAQTLVSVLAVLISHFFQRYDVVYMSGFIAPFIVMPVDIALMLLSCAPRSSPSYDRFISYSLGWLYQFTTIIGKYVLAPDTGFTQRQHIAVHSSLVFFILSELEFSRAYVKFKNYHEGFDDWKHFLLANVEPYKVFSVSRDPFILGYEDCTDGWNF